MTDQDRLIAFLEGIKIKHTVQRKDDVLLLPVEDIAYVNYATKVGGWGFVDAYFTEDGRLAGLAKAGPVEQAPVCPEFVNNHHPSGLECCVTCGWSESAHGGAS